MKAQPLSPPHCIICVWKETAACEERDLCQKEHPDSMGSASSSCQRVMRALDLPLPLDLVRSAPPSHAQAS